MKLAAFYRNMLEVHLYLNPPAKKVKNLVVLDKSSR
jgi:hypothetical protein